MKALIHLVPKSDAQDEFAGRLREVAEAIRELTAGQDVEVNVMLRLASDPLGRNTPFRGAIEVVGDSLSSDALEHCAGGLEAKLEEVAHLDLSSVLVGEQTVFIDGGKSPVRYQYLMRRRASFNHEDYVRYYRDEHSRFGLKTPGIEGYVQFYVDPAASRYVAGIAGCGVWAVDSVSELYMESIETFIAGVSTSNVGGDAAEDEKTFVDRKHSHHFVSNVEWHNE
jgi:hypothetical protein